MVNAKKPAISAAVRRAYPEADIAWYHNTLIVNVYGEEHILILDLEIPGLTEDDVIDAVIKSLDEHV